MADGLKMDQWCMVGNESLKWSIVSFILCIFIYCFLYGETNPFYRKKKESFHMYSTYLFGTKTI